MRRHAHAALRTTTTIKDIAQELGVSIATVSRALSRPEMLNERTRSKVMAAVERLGYRPNLLARSLRKGRTRALLLVAPNLSPFFLEIFAGAEQTARQSDFALLLGNSQGDAEREGACFDQVLSGQADGIILLTGIAPALYASGQRALPPLVSALEPLPGPPAVPIIRTDHRAGAAEATRHLLGLGHRRIAHITGSPQVPSTARRLQGYRDALTAAGLRPLRELELPGDFTAHSGAALIERLLALDVPPTAVLCANDETAFGVIRRLHQLGLAVPRDISVVGFDDLSLSAVYNPPLTTVSIPRYELGQRAAHALIELLEGRQAIREVILPTRLIVRESTAPPAARTA